MEKNYKKNIVALTVHLMFSKRFVAPIMMLYFQSFGLNFAQIGVLSALTQFTDATMEVFGGAFSDVYGRKRASSIYAILGFAAMAIYSFGSSYWHFAAAAILYGFAIAIGSGNAGALLYDTLAHLNLENHYKKFRGRMQFPSKILNSLILIAVPYLFLKHIRLPFILGMIFYCISFMTARALVTDGIGQRDEMGSIIKNIRSSVLEILSSRKLIFIICCEVVLNSFMLLGLEYYQPLLKEAGIPLTYIGLVYAAVKMIEGTASLLAYRITKRTSSQLLVMVAASLACATIGFAFFHNYFMLFSILLFAVSSGAKDIAIADILNKNITANNRTTIISTVNVFDGLFVSLLFFFFGYSVNNWGLQTSFGLASITFVLLLLALFALIKRRK